MNLKKILIKVFLLCFLNGCAQNAAFLGPAYTFASTGSALNTGLSYGSGKFIKNVKDQVSRENTKSTLATTKNSNIYKKDPTQVNFFKFTKSKIEKISGVINLANQ